MNNFTKAQRIYEQRRDFDVADICGPEERTEECPRCGGAVEHDSMFVYCVESEECEWMVEK